MSTVTVALPVPTPRFGMLSVVAMMVTFPSGRVTPASDGVAARVERDRRRSEHPVRRRGT